MITERQQRMRYVVADLLSSAVAWCAFNCVRYDLNAVHGVYGTLGHFLTSKGVLVGQMAFPLLMMAVYWLSGYYNEVFRKSRLQEVFTTFWSSVTNTLLLFFLALINDVLVDRVANYELLFLLWALLFFIPYTPRAIITNHTSRMIKSRRWSFRTLVIGRGAAAVAFVRQLNMMTHSLGYEVIGYVDIPGENPVKDAGLPCHSLREVADVCRQERIEELIVVPTRNDAQNALSTINHLFALNLPIKITPDRVNVLLSQVRLSDMVGAPLVDISGSNMSESEKNIKRLLDVVVSGTAMIVLLPVYLLVALLVKLDSPGDVIFSQERIGYHNVPFRIYKFRSMVADAEADDQPRLSSDNDPRITRIGRILRKYRIDELPQFYNVLRGDMSLVGPRPERQFFIDQIQRRVPSYALLHQVRPGLTSMGMVKYGYARNVDEMVQRLDYDLMYLENMSLINDLKIMVYTVKIVFKGRGL